MEELEVSSPMEEDEVRRSVRGTSDCDLRFWGNHGNSNYNHALGCRPSTSGHDRVDSTSGIANDSQRLNDGLCIALDSIWFLR